MGNEKLYSTNKKLVEYDLYYNQYVFTYKLNN